MGYLILVLVAGAVIYALVYAAVRHGLRKLRS